MFEIGVVSNGYNNVEAMNKEIQMPLKIASMKVATILIEC